MFFFFFFFFNDTATTEIYTLSLHDALPISLPRRDRRQLAAGPAPAHRRPGSGLLPGGPRELRPRLGRQPERTAAHPGAPRRVAASLRRARRTRRRDHAELPARRDLPPG